MGGGGGGVPQQAQSFFTASRSFLCLSQRRRIKILSAGACCATGLAANSILITILNMVNADHTLDGGNEALGGELTPAVSTRSACWPGLHGSPGAAAAVGQFHSHCPHLRSASFALPTAGRPPAKSGFLCALWAKSSGVRSNPPWPSCLVWKKGRKRDTNLLRTNALLPMATPLMASFPGVWGTCAPGAPERDKAGGLPRTALEEGTYLGGQSSSASNERNVLL